MTQPTATTGSDRAAFFPFTHPLPAGHVLLVISDQCLEVDARPIRELLQRCGMKHPNVADALAYMRLKAPDLPLEAGLKPASGQGERRWAFVEGCLDPETEPCPDVLYMLRPGWGFRNSHVRMPDDYDARTLKSSLMMEGNLKPTIADVFNVIQTQLGVSEEERQSVLFFPKDVWSYYCSLLFEYAGRPS